jgi:2-polyprenyl-6-methoxyphenol hydroxylase-like FAD-dependent oxidoreductase
MKRWPAGFIVIGDAVCVLNPMYGQGMTMAILEAIDLDTSLRQRGLARNFERNFQKRVARSIVLPWLLAASSDARAIKGQRANPYIEHLIRLLPQNDKVLQLFLEVIHMLRSPLALFHPLVVAKVVFHFSRM